MNSDPLHPDVMRAFNFTLNDLEANRASILSEAQTTHLERSNQANRLLYVAIAALFIAPSLCMSDHLLQAVLLLSAFSVLAYGTFDRRAINRDIQRARINYLHGALEFRRSPTSWNNQSYLLRLRHDTRRKKTFNLTKDQWGTLREHYIGGLYRVYYTPHTSSVIALEPLNELEQPLLEANWSAAAPSLDAVVAAADAANIEDSVAPLADRG
ncbi:MAG: hypothetical protein JW966_08320 [Anaerolineae bacterium]|nr:hypothetical protein [Anaerolineae bacterium]